MPIHKSISGRNMPIHFKEHLIVFTRYPEPGKTKTRLIPLFGAEGAADLQRKMTEHTLWQVKRLSTSRKLRVGIRYDGGDKNVMQTWLGQDFEYRPQGSGDLGRRMKCSLEDAFRSGASQAVIIGTDIPEITEDIIQKDTGICANIERVLMNKGTYPSIWKKS